jgi:hypothetical protein
VWSSEPSKARVYEYRRTKTVNSILKYAKMAAREAAATKEHLYSGNNNL